MVEPFNIPQWEVVSEQIAANFEQQIAFLQKLVQTPSINTALIGSSEASSPVERDLASVVAQELARLGFQATTHGKTPERPNVFCSMASPSGPAKTLILTTHMDTVPPSGYTRDPFDAHIEKGLLYGLGSADAKAQIAAMTYAASAIHQTGTLPAGHLLLAFVADEESGACSPYGTQFLLEQGILQGDAVIIGEPGDDKIAIGHRGLYRFRLRIIGEATHTGLKSWEQGTQGRNAILDMARLALALASHPFPASHSPVFPGRKTVLTFPTQVSGGSAINIVPDACEATGDVRLLPDVTAAEIKSIISTHLTKLGITAYDLEDLVVVSAAETDPQADIVQALAAAAETITGLRPRLAGSGPACDGWMFIQRGIPTVCGFGTHCGGVHGGNEWVDLASLQQITKVYAQAILRYLGNVQ